MTKRTNLQNPPYKPSVPRAAGVEEDDLVDVALGTQVTALQMKPNHQILIEDDDAELVERAQRGDQRAFSRLFEKHHSRVFSTCYKMLRNPAEVEDAVQQAFLEAWRCLPRFEGRSRFSTWLTRIAINTCFSFRRRLKRLLFPENYSSQAERGSVWTEENQTPDEFVARADQKEAIYAILREMSARKRVAFVLSDIEGRTAPEISEILNIPEATVRTRLFHARRDFAERAKKHPQFVDYFLPQQDT